jgi:hypothetical protein
VALDRTDQATPKTVVGECAERTTAEHAVVQVREVQSATQYGSVACVVVEWNGSEDAARRCGGQQRIARPKINRDNARFFGASVNHGHLPG